MSSAFDNISRDSDPDFLDFSVETGFPWDGYDDPDDWGWSALDNYVTYDSYPDYPEPGDDPALAEIVSCLEAKVHVRQIFEVEDDLQLVRDARAEEMEEWDNRTEQLYTASDHVQASIEEAAQFTRYRPSSDKRRFRDERRRVKVSLRQHVDEEFGRL